jgi:RNA polymerase sigma factor (sigma-70 family)
MINHTPIASTNVEQLVDHLFRHKAGEMVAILTAIFGSEHLQLAEDVVQETMLKALQQWSYRGIPNNPGGWLMQTAKNHALDVLRREANFQKKIPLLAQSMPDVHSVEEVAQVDNGLLDDQLTMLFMGCHPALSQEMQVSLLLKTLGGFSVAEIARALLSNEKTIAQRIVRAKRKIQEIQIQFVLPTDAEMTERLAAVLLVIYLIFNEGYNASHGNELIRRDLCAEVLRLAAMLLQHPIGKQAIVHALMALMLFHSARLDSRLNAANELLLLSEQDRSQWDKAAIRAGIYHLQQAGQGDSISVYHLQAGIAACHALAPDYEATNWDAILTYYDQWLEIAPSPLVQLNRGVALAMVESPQAGLDALDKITHLDNYYLLSATRAVLEKRLGQFEIAKVYFQEAITYTTNEVERRFLQRQLEALSS